MEGAGCDVENSISREELISRIEQLQHERDELRKDIEQLCLQQAGPGYLAAATRMHFQRTAGLEQEIEGLKKKLVGCARNKQNLQEELSEAYRIKSQLAELHNAEVLKNKEAEKQLRFFQSCVAAAFSERDNALMESEKAKEREEAASERLIIAENSVEELRLAYNDEKKHNADLQMELMELKQKTESFEKVINKFHEIIERETGSSGDPTWQEKCSRLLDDPSDNWSFNTDSKTSTSKYIASLEEELEKRKNSIDNLQSNLRMGLQIERHLKRNVQFLEKKHNILANTIKTGLSALRDFHSKQRYEVMNILEEETAQVKLILVEVQEKLNQMQTNSELKYEAIERGQQSVDAECRDVHITSDIDSNVHIERSGLSTTGILANETCDGSDSLAQALQEKVAALLLLSQQDERHMLERDVNQALQKKMEDLQRNLSQVTNEKVRALVDLAQLKQEYQQLLELKVEYAALQKSLANLGHLTSSIHRLRSTLLKARDDAKSAAQRASITEALSSIVAEANLVKTALGSSLPVSWYADAAIDAATCENLHEPASPAEAIKDRVDPACSAGLEMVELLILATQLLQDSLAGSSAQ